MVWLRLIYAILFPTLLGFCFINIFLNKKEGISFPERVSYGFLIGIMLITCEMFFILPRLNIKYSILSISLPLVAFIIWGLFSTIKNRLFIFKQDITRTLQNINKSTIFEKTILLLILINIFFVSATVWIKPVVGVDSWSTYSLRAKAYFIEGTSIVPSMPKTPRGQFDALSQTWMFTCLNDWNDILGKSLIPFFYLSLLIIFYYTLRRTQQKLSSLLVTYFLATLPFLIYHATLEYCDFLIAVYLFSAVSFLFLWFNKLKYRYLLLSLLFLISLINIKNEGLFHIVIVFTVFFITIFSRKMKNAVNIKSIRIGTFISFALVGVFAINRIFFGPNDPYTFLSSPDFSRIPDMISVFADYIFLRNNWGIIWPILAILVLFNHKKFKDAFNISLLLIILFEFFGFMVFYFVSSKEIYDQLFYVTPAVRNMLQFIPVTLFLIGNLITFDMPLPIPASQELKQNNNNRIKTKENKKHNKVKDK